MFGLDTQGEDWSFLWLVTHGEDWSSWGKIHRVRTGHVGCLDVMSSHKLTMRHSDRHHTSTQYFVDCDKFLLRHFDHVTFFNCDILTL